MSVIWDCVPGREHGREQEWHAEEKIVKRSGWHSGIQSEDGVTERLHVA